MTIKKYFQKITNNFTARKNVTLLGGIAGVIANSIIFAIEIVVGSITNSVAIMADAFHNLTDVISSVVVIISSKMANKPADKRHPFGHGRIEYLSTFMIAVLILVVGLEFVRTSFDKIIHPSAVRFDFISFILIIAAIPLKILLSRFDQRLSKKINSSELKAVSVDALNDVLILMVASTSLITAAFTKIEIDGYLGMIVAIFIIISGYSMIRKQVSMLIGEAPDPRITKIIYNATMNADHVTGVHDLVVHSYGPDRYMATIHAEMPSDISTMEAHDAIDVVEKELAKKYDINLVVHVDPLSNDNMAFKKANEVVNEALKTIPEVKSMHGLRVIGHHKSKSLVFTAVVDSRTVVSKRDMDKIRDLIDDKINDIDPDYKVYADIARTNIFL